MGTQKLPSDAFEHYFSLGMERSYQAVAAHFGTSKTAVSNLAAKEDWQQLVQERDQQARESAAKKSVETLAEMNERHLKLQKIVQKKALEALRSYPIPSAMDAVRSLEISIRAERLIRGEPTDRSTVGLEEIIRVEHQRWLSSGPSQDGEADAELESAGAAAGDEAR